MRRILVLTAWAACIGGCSGRYILTAPDQVAPVGGEATAVVRLQRHEVWFYSHPARESWLEFQIEGGPKRAAYADKLGYIGTTLEVPQAPGRYTIDMHYQDFEGDEVFGSAPVYVWEPNAPVVAVDLDDLPPGWSSQAEDAARAIRKLNERANICYFTRRAVLAHAKAHQRLAEQGYPDGPVLLWQRERWHLVRERWRLPKVVVEARLVSQLPVLRKSFPGLRMGVCRTALAGRAFSRAEMKCVVVGDRDVGPANVIRYASWAELAEKGVP